MPRKATTELTPAALRTEINRRFGEGTMLMASDPSLEITRIPCGILSVDYVMGGGFPRGRHTELFGGYSVGKTYTSLRLLANAQKLGLRGAFIDVEGTFDPRFAQHAGVDTESLPYHRQDYGNKVIAFMETLLRSRQYDIIVLDSIAALLPKSELESDMEGQTYGTAQAKLMSEALRRLTAANRSTALVYINQTRESIGSIFTKRTITSGGRAMGFYAGVRLEMVQVERIKRKATIIDPLKGDAKEQQIVKGHRVLVRIEKDKVGGGKPGDQSTFVFDYDLEGIDPIEDLIYLGRVFGFVHKKGTAWWLDGYEDEKQAGRNRFKRWLRRNKAVAEELEELILEGAPEPEEEDEEDDE